MSSTDIVVVYHALSEALYCEDGFASAVCAYTHFGTSASYYMGIHGKVLALDTFVGKEVYFLDFCYELEYMTAIAQVCSSLTVIDHHKAGEELPPICNWVTPPKGTVEASCILAFNYFMLWTAGGKLPVLLHHVRDTELWLHDDPFTKPYIYKLRTLPHTFDQWTDLLSTQGTVGNPSEAAETFIRQGMIHQEQVESLARTLADASFSITVDGVRGEAVNAPRSIASVVGEALVKKSGTFGACFYVDRDTAEVELRSAKGGYDVQALASLYGGGGQQSAAHFSLPLHRFISMFEVHPSTGIDLNSMLLTLYHGISNKWESHVERIKGATGDKLAEELFDLERDLNIEYSDAAYSVVAKAGYVEAPLSSAHSSFVSRLLYCLADSLNLPAVETAPKFYHKIFPYSIGVEPKFEEEDELVSMLRKATRTKGREEEEMLLDSMLATVKLSYVATLRRPTRIFTVTVNSPFGEVSRVFKI